jgi:ABC-2 type transport system ATP-binding protein
LLLDEPTNGVDPLSRRDFWNILYQLAKDGMTILVSTAYLDEAERCSRVGLMHHGRLIQCDSPANLKQALSPRSYRAEGAGLREARVRLQQTPGVLAAEPAGAAVHVFLRSPELIDDVRRQSGVSLTSIQPSLEDVFIALIREEEHRANAA